ncbi:sugar phosphate isomerase/epimerase family protein [Fusibacillus kribbianus]|uniref:Sugar phosphate isomerase/epimerase family protein n=1 Tax=Fusibacillus kribbianus TaxID=3044208 RepID=A0AAP4EXK8_9FIRM|nr:sugar phosphate isomerase/epimerase family protein [Ruminococcus sp. YH-rum2234]MDI9240986.1 sugar phosphate isomerase/epimerase family protein [Ruminococcus sp. YH-rum2234]
MRFGSLYSYWGTEWKCDYLKTLKKMKEAGCDVLEMGAGHVLEMELGELEAIRAAAKEYDMELTLNIGPPKDKDIASRVPEIRRAGIDYLCNIIHRMKYLDAKTFIGAMYSYWPCDFTDTDKPGNWGRSVESMKEIAKVAEDEGVTLCMEILNRFESYLINDCTEGLQYLEDVGSDSVKLLIDTFHANIEEDDIVASFYQAGDKLGHVHVGEANRKLPGMGRDIPWDRIGQALKDIHYDGAVVMEPFLLTGGSVGADVKVWRDLSNGADEKQMDLYLKDAVQFLRKKFL